MSDRTLATIEYLRLLVVTEEFDQTLPRRPPRHGEWMPYNGTTASREFYNARRRETNEFLRYRGVPEKSIHEARLATSNLSYERAKQELFAVLRIQPPEEVVVTEESKEKQETFRKAQEHARSTIELPPRAPEWEVLVDRLIEGGFLVAGLHLTRDDLLAHARAWAKRNAYRRTGRTTRMLLQALEAATNGAKVCVVASDDRHRRDLEVHLARLTSDPDAIRNVQIRAESWTRDSDSSVYRGFPSVFDFDLVVEDHLTTELREERRRERNESYLGFR